MSPDSWNWNKKNRINRSSSTWLGSVFIFPCVERDSRESQSCVTCSKSMLYANVRRAWVAQPAQLSQRRQSKMLIIAELKYEKFNLSKLPILIIGRSEPLVRRLKGECFGKIFVWWYRGYPIYLGGIKCLSYIKSELVALCCVSTIFYQNGDLRNWYAISWVI